METIQLSNKTTEKMTVTYSEGAKKKDVLVVDDSKTLRQMLIHAISCYKDFNIVEAEDGIAAMEQIKKNDIKLIFLDYNMPRMNGIEFMKLLRSQPAYKNVPIVMITTESEEDKVKTGYVSGATVYLPKPYKIEALLKIVDAMRYWHIK